MKKILILFAHPALQKSNVNEPLIKGLDDFEGLTLHDLYQAYPEFDIDIDREKELCEAHDVIVFQHPFFWYSTPAILKEWEDLVLQHDWAYGSKGNALSGKLFFNAITTGAKPEAYCPEGYNQYSIRQLLVPFEQTANLCKMIYLPPFVVHGTTNITTEEIEEKRAFYFRLLEMLRDDKLDLAKARELTYINDYPL